MERKTPRNGRRVKRQRWSEYKRRRNTELMSEEMMDGLKERQMSSSIAELCGRQMERVNQGVLYEVKEDDDTHTHTLPEAGGIL